MSIIGESLKLAGLINYQKGSIVSKTIIDKKVGCVTLFAFDKGQRLSTHTAPFDAMIFVPDGEAEVVIAGKSNMVGTGDMIIMPAGRPHSVEAKKRFKMLLIMIRA
ncbi:MAG: cupin [Deltaproteobacteria bacterium CG11_big_fil_rev_8_21_14_0_20_49_13]|nr:MAG: cupin [Deltaproteobacteria bacterium CG11_big_fil_rev_8_21_14_0_20_49_13]